MGNANNKAAYHKPLCVFIFVGPGQCFLYVNAVAAEVAERPRTSGLSVESRCLVVQRPCADCQCVAEDTRRCCGCMSTPCAAGRFVAIVRSMGLYLRAVEAGLNQKGGV